RERGEAKGECGAAMDHARRSAGRSGQCQSFSEFRAASLFRWRLCAHSVGDSWGEEPMHVRDAVASRFSCRAFLPIPVPLATGRDILDRAARAPSGGNLQPWRVHALSGAPLEDLKARIRPHAPTNPRGEGAEYAVYPAPLKEPYYARRYEVGAQLYSAIG